MTDKIILICCAIFLPLGLFIANKLIDRTQIKEKDRTIKDLTRMVNNLTAEKETAEKGERTAQKVADIVSDHSAQRVSNVESLAPLAEQAKHVQTEQDAIDLARKQVEANR